MDLAQRPAIDNVRFKTLAAKDADFNQVWQKAGAKLDFRDPATVLALSKAILGVEFGLRLQLPSDRLCPPIPNRWNYVAWIHSLVDSTSPSYSSTYEPERLVNGLDIGTGASAIYTMLCLQSRPNWSMCATDVDQKSFESATLNLIQNSLSERTKLLQTTEVDPLIPLEALGVDRLDFTICNPPFFTDTAEMTASLEGENKTCAPHAVCTGTEVEMVCPGGDVGFVTRIVNESLKLRDKVQWYTSMFGKLGSMKTTIELLKSHGITNWAVGYIGTGITRRWLLGWSFADLKPENSIARIATVPHSYLPYPTTHVISLDSSVSLADAKLAIDTSLSALRLEWRWDPTTSSGIGEAKRNVWSRAYRRACERKKPQGIDDSMSDDEAQVQLAFRVSVLESSREVEIRWLRGSDQVLWESWNGFLHRLLCKQSH